MSRKENNKMEPRVILRPASSGETGLFFMHYLRIQMKSLELSVTCVLILEVTDMSSGIPGGHVIMKDHIALHLNPI